MDKANLSLIREYLRNAEIEIEDLKVDRRGDRMLKVKSLSKLYDVQTCINELFVKAMQEGEE